LSDDIGVFNDFAFEKHKAFWPQGKNEWLSYPRKEREHISEEDDLLESLEVDGECGYEGCYRFASTRDWKAIENVIDGWKKEIGEVMSRNEPKLNLSFPFGFVTRAVTCLVPFASSVVRLKISSRPRFSK
jgi:hypothetical protein